MPIKQYITAAAIIKLAEDAERKNLIQEIVKAVEEISKKNLGSHSERVQTVIVKTILLPLAEELTKDDPRSREQFKKAIDELYLRLEADRGVPAVGEQKNRRTEGKPV